PANLGSERLGGEERFEGALVDADGPGAGAEAHARGRCLATTCAVILNCCHVTRPRASWVSAPCADDPDRHTPSICDTSPGPSSSSGACRGRLPRRDVPAGAGEPDARVLRAIRPHSPSAGDRFFDLP